MDRMSGREMVHLAVSTIVLTVAFGIAFSGGTSAFNDTYALLDDIKISFIAVGLGFTFHEMAHRLVARRYGFSAEYYMSPLGLGIALVLSLSGWIFAAPGAVRIYGSPSAAVASVNHDKIMGKISLAGPLTNICIAALFLIFGFFATYMGLSSGESPMIWKIAIFGTQINAWLALFNMIPFRPLDGGDVFKWNKAIWITVTILSAGLYLLVVL
jgi:Zn-dependent protease